MAGASLVQLVLAALPLFATVVQYAAIPDGLSVPNVLIDSSTPRSLDASIEPYTAQGYYREPPRSESRAFGAKQTSSTSSDIMTVETCAAFCSDYKFFGVEYARECWCGYDILETHPPPMASAIWPALATHRRPAVMAIASTST
jgi:hypothetical protein